MSITHRHVSRRPVRAALVTSLLVALAGCSPPTAKVTGKVTYRGQAVTAGTVAFFGPGNQVASAPLGDDGSYAAVGVPLGQVTVTVTTPSPGPNAEQLARNPMVKIKKVEVQATDKAVTVPAKYGLPGTSGLTTTVAEGSQSFNIELK